MILMRLKNYSMFTLLFGFSLIHFVFGNLAEFVCTYTWGSAKFLDYTIPVVHKLKIESIPILGFMAFTFMIIFMVFDYWMVRKPSFPKMGICQFVKAFLFSQLAYLGFIYGLVKSINGIHAVYGGILSLFINLPMFICCFPLSAYLFKVRVKKIILLEESNEELNEKKAQEDKAIMLDCMIFWFIALIAAVMSFNSN